MIKQCVKFQKEQSKTRCMRSCSHIVATIGEELVKTIAQRRRTHTVRNENSETKSKIVLVTFNFCSPLS